jgi:hypothetical protein
LDFTKKIRFFLKKKLNRPENKELLNFVVL